MMTSVQFRQWRLRMGKLTIQQSADALGCSFGSAKGYGDGNRDVPAYIEKLCVALEQEKNRQEFEMSKNRNKPTAPAVANNASEQKPAGINIAAILANAYRQVRAKRSPAIAMTLNLQMLEQEMADALETLSQNGVEIHATDKAKNNQTAG